jgi:hypothetical protein
VWVSRALTVNGGGMPRALIKDVWCKMLITFRCGLPKR